MAKGKKFLIITLCALLLAFSIAGCNKVEKKDKREFVRGPDGLVMSFVPNYPPDKFIVGNTNEPISILVEVRNKGAYPLEAEQAYFGKGDIHLSGFDTSIIQMGRLSRNVIPQNLPAASDVNPGGIDTVEFDGNILAGNVQIDKYNPTILVTACYPYVTTATSTVCIDPEPFDTKQEKVCAIGSQNVPNQGAPIAVTRIDQEAAGGKIHFKISIKNVGKGEVIWGKDGIDPLLDRCNPNQGGRLNRKDFDRVQLEKVGIGNVDLFAQGKCAPFADGTNNLVWLFNGEGFVICTYDIPNTIQSAFTTPIEIKLRYAYRSTISKPIQIKKLAVGSPCVPSTSCAVLGCGKTDSCRTYCGACPPPPSCNTNCGACSYPQACDYNGDGDASDGQQLCSGGKQAISVDSGCTCVYGGCSVSCGSCQPR